MERIVRHAPRRHQPANRNISQLEKRSYDLKQNGIDFLVNADDYLRVNTIRECRNLITHNQGIITQAFNGIFPTVPPGVGQRIRLYPVDVADDANFLLRECFRLDDLAAQQFGIERKVFPAWQEHYRYERKV